MKNHFYFGTSFVKILLLTASLVFFKDKAVGQSNFNEIFFLNFNANKANLLKNLYSTSLEWTHNKNYFREHSTEDNNKLYKVEGLRFYSNIHKSSIEPILRKTLNTTYHQQSFWFINDKLIEQDFVCTFKDKSVAVSMCEKFKEYFNGKGFVYLEEANPIDRRSNASAVSYRLYKSANERKTNFKHCEMVRIDLVFHKVETYSVSSKEKGFLNVATICVQLGAFKDVDSSRIEENYNYILDYDIVNSLYVE
ncbi:hypothetical protein [Sphingobacterium luzhongxinii]|uniref:hypothetical protein n=1 Tax=Sphingobacterium luzhongxinii TaxID=2654181 RepID=UPI0013DD64C5|nr:hypothetical protein [Sphingobacterium sp. xlx-73]